MIKHLVQTILYPFIWSWYYVTTDHDGIWMPEFPYNTEKYIWAFVKKFGYKSSDTTYKFCDIFYYHEEVK